MLLALFLGTFGSSRPSAVRVEDCFLPFLLGGFSIEFGQNLCIRFTSKTIILDSVPQFFQQIETRIENLSVCNLSNQSTLVTNTVIRDLDCTLSLLLVCIPAQEFGGPPNFSGLRDRGQASRQAFPRAFLLVEGSLGDHSRARHVQPPTHFSAAPLER